MKIWFCKERWRSPAYMFNLFEIRMYRTNYIAPSVIAYCFKLTLFGFRLLIELRKHIRRNSNEI